MSDSTNERWWRITVAPRNLPSPLLVNDLLDEIGFELIELGAVSTSIEEPPNVTCFVRGDRSTCDSFVQQLPMDRWTLLEHQEVNEENWNAKCPEVWQPVRAGVIDVVPVSSSTDPRPVPSGAIRIIPGQGFGTGHHATTRMVLEEMSNLAALWSPTPSRILDIGTGSGILAIAAAIAFRCPVDGNDIDQDAINNASENVALNGVTTQISLSLAPTTAFNGPYGLVVANVYAEVLLSMQGEISRLTAPGGYAILSGITELVTEPVLSGFLSSHKWDLVRERTESDWGCLVLKRKGD